DALVDHVDFAVGAGAIHCARVEDFVAALEHPDVRPDVDDDACDVPAEYLRFSCLWGLEGPDLVVDGVHRYGLDRHEQIMGARDRVRDAQVNQDIGRASRPIPDRLHCAPRFAMLPMTSLGIDLRCPLRPTTIISAPYQGCVPERCWRRLSRSWTTLSRDTPLLLHASERVSVSRARRRHEPWVRSWSSSSREPRAIKVAQ